MVAAWAAELEEGELLAVVRAWVADSGLTLHPEKTRIVEVDVEGVDFLGYHFQGKRRWPRKRSIVQLKDAIRAKTRRTNGHSLDDVIAAINPTLRGWFAYFQHSHWTTFRPVDGWIRMRLRAILRRRTGRRGCGPGADHQRWPNTFFAEHGLFTLVAAHRLACQSALR